MKKVITVVFAAVAVLITAAVLLVAVRICIYMFSPPDSMSRVKNVRNVYDEVWNLMSNECRGKKTVLSSATPEAYKDFDPWLELRIPEYVALFHCPDHDGPGELSIFLYTPREEPTIHYTYCPETKILTGEKDEAYLLENFLKFYFEWLQESGKSSEYSIESLGEYTFEIITE